MEVATITSVVGLGIAAVALGAVKTTPAVVNCVIDAAYRSMKSGRWEPVETDAVVSA